MPYKEAASWVCLTMLGAAMYFLFDWWGQQRWAIALALALIAIVGLGYLVYQHHHPDSRLPSTGMWVWLPLILTWCLLGYSIQVSRTVNAHRSAGAPPARITAYFMGMSKDRPRHIFVVATVAGSPTAEKYRKAYSLYVFCLVGSNQIDPGKDTAIDRSEPFDLADRPVDIQVTLGKENTERILKSGLVDVYLLMIPKSVDSSHLLTFDDIYEHGGRLLDHTAMGESVQRMDAWWNSRNLRP